MTKDRRANNLRRGGVPATPEAAARARSARAMHADGDRLLGELAGRNPYGAYEEIHATMTKSIVRLLRAEERAKGVPSREVTDRLREYRQLTEALAVYNQSKGVSEEAEEFFKTLDDRLSTLLELASCPTCGSPAVIDAYPLSEI